MLDFASPRPLPTNCNSFSQKGQLIPCFMLMCTCALAMIVWFTSQIEIKSGKIHTLSEGLVSRLDGQIYTERYMDTTEWNLTSTETPYAGTTEEMSKGPSVFDDIRRYTESLPRTDEVSVVTAYFKLGALGKMSSEGQYTPDLYRKWMSTFGRLNNSLVVYVDTQEYADFFKEIRARFPPNLTTVILVQRKDLWSFSLAGKIQAVFAQKGYPKHSPNTINPLYSCAMHAKFELMERTLREHRHTTRHIAWLDIGLFRALSKDPAYIHLRAPPELDPNKVGYSQVNPFAKMTPKDIVWGNRVWVGGASFVGFSTTLYSFCSEYQRAVQKLLDMNIMSTDQQVLYSMFQPSFDFSPKVKIQTYESNGISESWFCIGYIMKRSGDQLIHRRAV